MGKLLILPIRQTVTIEGLPDLTLTLEPGNVMPPQPPPIVVPPPPIPQPPPPVQPPGSGDFRVVEIGQYLPWAPENNPVPATWPKSSLTFHWEGADVLAATEDGAVQNALVGIAIQHIAKQWAPGVYGNGVMYHECITPLGNSLIMRDYTDVVWHCGDERGNLSSRAILVYCSKATPPTGAQLLAIGKRIADFSQSAGHAIPAYPHSKWSPTECPGDKIRSILGY